MFDSRFAVYLADTAESRQLHHRVRYQVFCLERGFESPDECHNQLEVDDWDPQSAHFVVMDRNASAAVAAVRIVLPGSAELPVQSMGCITEALPEGVLPEHVGEISRICVARKDHAKEVNPFRRARNDDVAPVDAKVECEILMGMIRAIIRYSKAQQVPYLYMLVTKPFARLLKRLGVVCQQAGEGVEHRGTRVPYLIDVRASREALIARSGVVAEMFNREYLAFESHARAKVVAQRAGQPVAGFHAHAHLSVVRERSKGVVA